jgi:hypothetical protein
MRELGEYGCFLTSRNEFERAKDPLEEALHIGKSLLGEDRGNYETKQDTQTSAFALSHCYVKTGDLDNAKRILQEFLVPLTKQLQAVDKDEVGRRFREALCQCCEAEIASAEQKWDQAEQLFLRSVSCFEKNCEVRNYPSEKSLYGDCLARLGRVMGNNGRPEVGCRYIERGLAVLRNLQIDAGIPGVVSDISDAEQALMDCKQRIEDGRRSVAAASH